MSVSALTFKYTNPVDVLFSYKLGGDLGLDVNSRIDIVGDRDNANYEYVVYRGTEIAAQSDDAYGIPGVALRDALI